LGINLHGVHIFHYPSKISIFKVAFILFLALLRDSYLRDSFLRVFFLRIIFSFLTTHWVFHTLILNVYVFYIYVIYNSVIYLFCVCQSTFFLFWCCSNLRDLRDLQRSATFYDLISIPIFATILAVNYDNENKYSWIVKIVSMKLRTFYDGL